MIAIDGSQKSGSGTIVRCGVGLATLLGEELEIKNIRAKREKPGLRAQYLGAISACRDICSGEVEKATVGSKEIEFKPRGGPKGGSYEWDIGTAASTTMLAQAILPLACFADRTSTFIIQGGLFQDFAPSFSSSKVWGGCAELTILRPGYVPRGGGRLSLK
ncbi:MAG: RNA 3'-terminal phosphate cyclase [Dehalococcoidia bacterium]